MARSMLLSVAVMALITGACTAPAQTKRRVIINDDGEVKVPTSDDWDAYIARRFTDTVGTHVDTYFLNVAATDRAADRHNSLQSTMAWWADPRPTPANYEKATKLYIDRAHEAGMEIFASIRMNDMHDAMEAKLNFPWKVQHPEWLIGDVSHKGTRRTYMNGYWCGLNWAIPQVRDYFHDFIKDHCTQFDYDGVELDLCRGQMVFKLGEEAQNIETMNKWVRRVHATLDEIGKRRGRPYLLTVRALSIPDASLRAGYDVEQWMKEGLLDLLIIGGGGQADAPDQKLYIDMAHQYGIPAYPCINHFKTPQQMRTWASNFWAMGADGVYFFNYFGVEDGSEKHKVLSQMGDPKTLIGHDKLHKPDPGFVNWAYAHESWPGALPVGLVYGTPVKIIIGDDLSGTDARARLTVQISGLEMSTNLADVIAGIIPSEAVMMHVNGKLVADVKRLDKTTYTAHVPTALLRRGVNEVRVMPGKGSSGRIAAKVESMQMLIDYPPYAAKPQAAIPKPPVNLVVVRSTTKMPVSLYDVPLGTSKTIAFDVTADLGGFTAAQLAIEADDIDQPEEATLTVNDQKIAIPNTMLSDSGRRVGMIDVPLSALKQGANEIAFTFASNLGETTRGYDIFQATLVLKKK